MAIDLFSFNSTMRRLSCVPEALSLVPQRMESRQESSFDERRASQQEIDCAVQWLQRRKSTDVNGLLGHIDQSLYRKRNSVVNVFGSKDLLIGKVQIKMSYDFNKADFIIILVEAVLDIKLDEYQLVFILEDLRKESRKATRGCALNSQTFKFPIPFDQLLEKTLTIELISSKSSGYGIQRHGVSIMFLSTLSPADELNLCVELEAVNDKESCGELQLFLSYFHSVERLTLTIQQAVKLERLEPNQKDKSVYVKASLIVGDKVIKKRKTNSRKANASNSFVWNEALSFGDIDVKTLSKSKLEVVVMVCNSNGNQYPIGQVTFKQSEGNLLIKETKIWRDMIQGRSANLLHWVQLHEIA